MIYKINGVEVTEEEYITAANEMSERYEKANAILELTAPLSSEDIAKMFIKQNINDIITDDATASRAIEYHPTTKYDNSLIKAGTRINWNGTLKRAAVDLWDTETNNPDNAPSLWEDINYRDGIREIPETITATLMFNKDELGWWGDTLYKSTINGNVYTPEQHAQGWEVIE